MRTIKIFLASSSELKEDRDQFDIFINEENKRLIHKEVFLEVVQWEYFQDSLSLTSKQDDYNKAIQNSQIVICLFFTKAGKYTQEEFDTALKQFKETGSPLIYTYFRAGAPEPDPTDQMALDLAAFKKRLSDIGHFYTQYDDIGDLKYQFRKQLDLLEDKGIIVLQQEVQEKTKDAVTNYFNSKNMVTGTVSAGGDVNIGDKIKNTSTTQGDNNIVIQGVTASTITVNVDGQTKEIEKKLDVLTAFMEQLSTKSIQAADKKYNIKDITNANFGYLIGQAGREKSLPVELAENLIGEGDGWIESLRQELERKQKISVSKPTKPLEIIQNYGWLVEIFLQKMLTPTGRKKDLRRLSFMVEAWQGSLRYLCYIQVAQLLQMEIKPKLGIVSDFLEMEGDEYLTFDYSSLLLVTTAEIGADGFMPELTDFVDELNDTGSSLYPTALFLEKQRNLLLKNEIKEDERLPALLDEYLTALVYWLRKVSFLAKYRMVSIKEINLDYRLGTAKNFVHLYGELHGFYGETGSRLKDYDTKWVEDAFTYSKSVLLFRGSNVSSGLDQIQNDGAYLNLSPLIIDQSVYATKPTQTPEIYYYSGLDKLRRCYGYALYKNEIVVDDKKIASSNKMLEIKAQNNNQPQLDELFEQLEHIFKPLKRKDNG